MNPSKRVRVVDVARVAGCSSATVSRALNSPDKVSPGVLARVLSAVNELDFTPNNAARALRSRRTRICGAVIPTLNHAIYARAVNALEERLGEAGYSLIVTTSEYDPARELRQTRLLVERGAEAIMLVGDSHDIRLYDLLHTQNVPYVNTYVFNPRSGHPCVGFDNGQAARQIMEFLILLGHRDIGVIAGVTTDNDRATQRLRGAREALAEHGAILRPERVVEEPYSNDAGYDGMRTLLARGTPPTAVICFSDVLAIGALAFCADDGISVPEDLSVVGFDNLEYAAHVRPALTTIEVPAGEMGRRAAEYLIGRLQGDEQKDAWELETKLIVRATTQPPKRQAVNIA
jgi:LacI family transcriptional regulator